MPDFLLEIGTEEIPDWMIEPALLDLRARFEACFGAFTPSTIVADATPRRLVLLAEKLIDRAPDTEIVVAGPYLSLGPKAAEGFARKQGTTLDQLAIATDVKGERYVYSRLDKGPSVTEALAQKVPGIIEMIPFPRAMSWPGSGGVRFIRPIRWILALIDEQTVPFEVAGVKSGNTTRGHRVLGSKSPLTVSAKTYFDVLRHNGVIVRAQERQERIQSSLDTRVQADPDLVATLVYLTEFPSVIRGSFDQSFLELPKEILSTVMRHHQRYFSVIESDGGMAAEFCAVTNTDGDPEGLIQRGNERVLRARFNDARFFWRVDQQKKLSDRLPDLQKLTFQAQLGTYEDKTKRVVELAGLLAEQTGGDRALAERAALLSKCDLTTEMVKEFTELQGVVGGLYARAQGEPEPVAQAIYDQYKPVSMDAEIPRTPEGQALSVADKLDTLRECFRVGLIPTGSKDPLALRRAGQGIVKILFEARLPVCLFDFTRDVPELTAFLIERIQFYLREVRGYAYDEVNAVTATELTTLPDIEDRVRAIHNIRRTEDFEPVAASFKRIKNILRQANYTRASTVDPSKIEPGPERDLFDALICVRREESRTNSYRDKLQLMASLRPQVDLFFDKILVNDPDPAIRQNRLALLDDLLTNFSSTADFSEIVTQGGLGA